MSQEISGEHHTDAFTSKYTSNFPALLKALGISLAVSTYQAGKLILVRNDQDKLNTHFRPFASPMGIAFDPELERLAIGTNNAVWEFRNQPAVAPKLEPAGRHDAAFVPRVTHHTGDIRIHEIGYVQRELWAVNTRFSCLCTFDRDHSFVPRWRPPFISAFAPEDRCHLNGMAIEGDRIRFVSCFGATDTAGGWRENKASGGMLLDVASGEIVLRGLSMPHSPRLRNKDLWILESGRGAVGIVDLALGQVREIARLPGFTRGIDFYDRFAFIGLSQVRESAIFSGIPLVDDKAERQCGVWVLDTVTGKTVAFLCFEGAVQEIFAVQVLPQIRFPDIIIEPGEPLNNSFVLPDDALQHVPGYRAS